MAERPKAPLGHYILVIFTDLTLAADTVGFALHVKLLTIVAYINMHTTCRTMSVTFNLKDVAYVAFGSVQSPSGPLPSRTSRNLYTPRRDLSWAFQWRTSPLETTQPNLNKVNVRHCSPQVSTAQLLKSETVVGSHTRKFEIKKKEKEKNHEACNFYPPLVPDWLECQRLVFYPWSQCSSLVSTAQEHTLLDGSQVFLLSLFLLPSYAMLVTWNPPGMHFILVQHSEITPSLHTKNWLHNLYKEWHTYCVHQQFPTPLVLKPTSADKSTHQATATQMSLY